MQHKTICATGRSTLKGEILEILRELPGLTTQEILELMPHTTRSSVFSLVSKLVRSGAVEVAGTKPGAPRQIGGKPYPISTYRISANPTPNVVQMRRKQPSETALTVRIKELEDRIAELTVWKNAAIARYPDLAVDTVVLKARKLVAEEVRAGGDVALADQIIAGNKDATLMVRVTIKALEEVA